MYSDNMDDPVLCLSWNDHMDNILNVFMEQLTSENLVDVTIMCEGKFIKAHKMVLSACSPYLHDILTMHNVPDPVIIMNNVKFSDMKQVIDFMYCGQIKVSVDDFKSVVSLAQSLQIKGLSEEGNMNHEGGPEMCVQPIIQEPPFNVNKLKFEGRTGRRKKRPVQNKPPSDSEYQQMPVETSLAKEIKTEPAEIEESESQCAVEDSSNNFEEYGQWSEEERKPDRMMLDYLRNSSENPEKLKTEETRPSTGCESRGTKEWREVPEKSGTRKSFGRRKRKKKVGVSYSKISVEQRRLLVQNYEKGKRIREAGAIAGINIHTARSIIRNYKRNSHQILLKERGGNRPTILTNSVLSKIKSIAQESSGVTLRKIQFNLMDSYNLKLSLGTIRKALKKLGITLKWQARRRKFRDVIKTKCDEKSKNIYTRH